ncbi:hypothetical protein FRC19_008687 [Serendipita sp. 401]|nr:hypothetical protein FRC19_008687 [Serendipita sp. 401]
MNPYAEELLEKEGLESTAAVDHLDLDLLVKVASHTVFSPFFTFFIPLIYKSVGHYWTDTTLLLPTAWFLLMTTIWLLRFVTNKWRNAGTPGRLDWGDQIIVITGGSSGVGALLAETLAMRQCTVVVLDLKPIDTEHDNINYYKCDISNGKEVEAAAKKIERELGPPTVIINNAGIVQGKLITDLTEEDVKQTFNVNVLGQFNVLRVFLPYLLAEKEGHVVTMSSLLGYSGCAQVADYAASKAALISLHDSLRQELDYRYRAPLIRTTLLTPGLLQTSMFAGMRPLKESAMVPGWLFDFLMPTLPPHVIVKEIIKALDLQESRDIVLPQFGKISLLMLVMPYWVKYFSKWVSGSNLAMKGFQKTEGGAQGTEHKSKDD